MAATAFQTQYRQEFVNGFEVRQSYLRSTVTTEANVKGTQAVFNVVGSGAATAVTRGVNGLIPSRSDDQTQYTATLAEWHDLVQKTGFNVTSSQGDQRRLMQETSMAVINRKIDADIIAQLDTATNDTGAAATASVGLVAKSIAILGINAVPIEEEDNMFGLISPAFHAYLMQQAAFASADYVDVKPFAGPVRRFRRWYGINWITHPSLTGVGTSSEKCYVFHRSAIGHAFSKDIAAEADYNREQDYSWARTSIYMGSKLLQNSGVVQVVHDGSAYVAT